VTRPIHVLVDDSSAATSEELDRLVKALAALRAAHVEVRADARTSDTDVAFLLVLASEPPAWVQSLPRTERDRLLKRMFLLMCRVPPRMFEVLEQHGVAGGIDNLTFSLWARGRHKTGYGVAGRRDVVAKLGRCSDEPYASQGYCLYESAASHTLAGALVEYLAALDATAEGRT
jgi:hypothetical protein